MKDIAKLGSMLKEWLTSQNIIDVLFQHRKKIPVYGSEEAAGFDLEAGETIALPPQSSHLFHCDLHLAIPVGYFGFIKERSSIAGRNMWTLGGVIDSDYRGSIKCRLYNGDSCAQLINLGERIAQMILIPCGYANFISISSLPETKRGSGGFGSTGK